MRMHAQGGAAKNRRGDGGQAWGEGRTGTCSGYEWETHAAFACAVLLVTRWVRHTRVRTHVRVVVCTIARVTAHACARVLVSPPS